LGTGAEKMPLGRNPASVSPLTFIADVIRARGAL
jgi:hypothetical protein